MAPEEYKEKSITKTIKLLEADLEQPIEDLAKRLRINQILLSDYLTTLKNQEPITLESIDLLRSFLDFRENKEGRF